MDQTPNLKKMHGRISHEYPLTPEETRWLWNQVAGLVKEICDNPCPCLGCDDELVRLADLGRISEPKIRCDACDGSGKMEYTGIPDHVAPCSACNGEGLVERTDKIRCDKCDGTGKSELWELDTPYHAQCSYCMGTGLVERTTDEQNSSGT
jgi:hypothetical protein